MLKFVTADAGTFSGQKRKQSQRACEDCRRKKKRCDHLPTSGSWASGLRSSGSHSPESRATVLAAGQRIAPSERESTPDTTQDVLSLEAPDRPLKRQKGLPLDDDADQKSLGARFIGDLNPEGVFLAATSPDTTRGQSSSIGVWLTEKLKEKVVDFNPNVAFEQSPESLFYGSASVAQKVLVPILVEECLSLLPPPADLQALSSFYFEKIHPILPVIDRVSLQDLPTKSPVRILLQQGICLAASMNFCSKQHLRFSDGEPPQAHGEFGRRLFAAMRMSIEMGVVTDKVVLIQALALMSLFVDGPHGKDSSSEFCGRAVQYVHSLGLHIQGRCRDEDDQYSITLLSCIWVLDRMNAATGGRPVLMHDRDMGRDMEACFQRQEPCFRLLLSVITLLDKVIQIYRPVASSTESELENDFLSFEELLVKCTALQAPTPLLATIESLYHAVAMLSCRPRFSETNSRSSASYIRQSLSALRATSIVEQELRSQLVLLPFVPYAVSLSLSIAYREMRHNKVPMYRARARTHLRTNCKILEQLGEIFWTASIMADMGKSTLKELDRVYSTMVDTQQRVNEQDSNLSGTNGVSIYASDQSYPFNGAEALQAVETIPSCFDGSIGTTSMPQDFSPFIFNDLPDVDVFEMFDPNFDLDGIDACLQGNLDLSFPINF